MTHFLKVCSVTILTISGLFLAGCQRRSLIERAADSLRNAAEKAADTIKDATKQ